MDRYIALTAKLEDVYREREDVLARMNIDDLRNEIRTPNGGRYLWDTMHACRDTAVERLRRSLKRP